MNKKASKYIFSLLNLLLAIFLIFLISHTPFKQEAIAEGEVEIYTLQDLDAVRNDLTASYILMNNLDFNDDASYDQTDPDWATKKTAWTTGTGWDPIGSSSSNAFTGTFDGQSYSISNLFINKSGYPAGYYVGLFGYSTGEISNTSLINANVTGTNSVGGLIGQISYGTITNCSVSGLSSFTGSNNIGALVGSFSSSSISNSYYNYDTITINASQPYSLGSLEEPLFTNWYNNSKTFDFTSFFSSEGEYYLIDTVEKLKLIKNLSTTFLKFKLTTSLDLSSDPGFYIPYFNSEFDGQGFEISNLELNLPSSSKIGLFGTLLNNGTIKNLGVTSAYVNGYSSVGLLNGYNSGEIYNSFSTGEIVGFSYVGGLVGDNYGIVEYCHSNSSVTQIAFHVGGLVGSNSSTIKDSYFLGTIITGSDGNIGGLVGDNFGASISNSYYNIDQVTIDGSHILTMGGLYNSEFDEWLSNGRYLDPDDHLSYENGYYQINNLQDFKKLLAFGQISGLKFELNSDIDLSGDPNFFIPYLAGEFEGNNHTISNLTYTSTADKVSQVGLFGVVRETGSVRNLGSINVNIDAGYELGGMVGENHGVIENTYSTGAISINYWGEDTGGLVGRNYAGLIKNSYSTVSVVGNYYAGGLVGANSKAIENSYATGSVAGNYFVGGLAGGSYGSIANSYSIGSVTDLAGDDYHIGGLVGVLGSSSTTTNSFWDTETSGKLTSAAGTPKTASEMKNISTFNSWDIVSFLNFNPSDSSTWYIKDTEYPSLAMQFVGPEVETLSSTDITKTTATISGNLTTLASESTVDVYFRYRTDAGDWINTTPLTKTSTEGYTAELVDLIPRTIYEYSTVVTWRDVGTDYGETLTFTTEPDLIKPTGEITINGNKTYTVSREVSLSLSATDDLTDVTLMMVCNNSSFTGCSWENYSRTKQWTLTSGEGAKTVYVKFKDGAGNISSVYSDSIILHTLWVKITDIGLISNILDKSPVTYYFTSTKPIIKGKTQDNGTVSFEYDDEIYTTQADENGSFTITLTVERGSNEIEYYSSDTSGNISTTRELALIVGTENFPDWLLERLGLLENNEEEKEETVDDTEDDDKEEPEDEDNEEEDSENQPPVSNTQKIKFTDKRGNPISQATVEIEGNTYVTNSEGEIEVENFEDRTYTAKVKTKDGKEYNMDILGVGDGQEIVVELDMDSGINWRNIIIYSGIGLVILVVILIIFTKKKETPENY